MVRQVRIAESTVVPDIHLPLAHFNQETTVVATVPTEVRPPEFGAPATIAERVIDNAPLRTNHYEDVLPLLPKRRARSGWPGQRGRRARASGHRPPQRRAVRGSGERQSGRDRPAGRRGVGAGDPGRVPGRVRQIHRRRDRRQQPVGQRRTPVQLQQLHSPSASRRRRNPGHRGVGTQHGPSWPHRQGPCLVRRGVRLPVREDAGRHARGHAGSTAARPHVVHSD